MYVLQDYLTLFDVSIFQLAGNICHLFAIQFLLLKILQTRSCSGVSGQTQILFAIVFVTRYSNIFVCYVDFYNTAMKVIYTIFTLITIYLIYGRYCESDSSDNDSFDSQILVVPCVVLAFIFHTSFQWHSIAFAFSVYLEAVAIIPQIWLTNAVGFRSYIKIYLTALVTYRLLYMLDWMYVYLAESWYDPIRISGGCVQIIVFVAFLWLGCKSKKIENKYEIFTIECKKSSPLDFNITEKGSNLLFKYIQRKFEKPKDIEGNVLVTSSETERY